MSVLVAAGPYQNLLETALTVTASPAADSLFPTTKLYDRNPGQAFKFGSSTADPTLTFDVDRLLGTGGFEDVTFPPTGWTEADTGTGDVLRDTVTFNTGVASARFDAGSGLASLYYDVTVRTGQKLQLSYDARGDAGVGRMKLTVRNLQTGNYCVGAGAPATVWQSAANELSSVSGTVWTSFSWNITVEPYSTVGAATTVLRLEFRNDNVATSAWTDTVLLLPAVGFASIHGHNIDPRMTTTLRSSTDNFSGSNTQEATFTLGQPSFYTKLSAVVYRRYWRVLFTGTQSTRSGAIYIGELYLGEILTLATGAAYSLNLTPSDPRITIPRRVGAPAYYQLSQFEQRTCPITFRCETYARQLEVMNEVFLRCRGGAPLVCVPHDSDSFTDVYYGCLSGDLPKSWQTKNYVTLQTQVEELAFPLVTA